MSFLVQTTSSADQVSIGDLLNSEASHSVSIPSVGGVQRLSVDAGETGEIVRVAHHLTFHRKGVTDLRSRYEGETEKSQRIYPGCLHIRPAQLAHASAWNSRAGLTVVSLEAEFLRNHASDITPFDPASINLRPMIGLKDKFLWHLGARLDALVSTPDRPTVFVEQIMATMAMHLVLMSDGRPVKVRSRALSRKALRLTSEYVEANLSNDIRLDALAALAGLSIYHFSRQFSREMGMGVGRYIQVRKMQRAAELLAEKTLAICEIGEAVGYRDTSSFSRAFRSVYGLSPHAYRSASS